MKKKARKNCDEVRNPLKLEKRNEVKIECMGKIFEKTSHLQCGIPFCMLNTLG